MSKTTASPAIDESDDPAAKLREQLGIKRFRDSQDENAKTYLTRVLTATQGDRIKAAAIAGLNRTHLQALIKRHEVKVKPNLKNRGRHKSKQSESAGETSEAAAADEITW